MSSLLNAKETAELLGLNIYTLYSLARRKQIPYIKIGKLVRFEQRELEVWLQGKKIKSTNE